jgi:hypothetical protein
MYALKLPKGVPVASVQAVKKSGCICFKYTAAVDSYSIVQSAIALCCLLPVIYIRKPLSKVPPVSWAGHQCFAAFNP